MEVGKGTPKEFTKGPVCWALVKYYFHLSRDEQVKFVVDHSQEIQELNVERNWARWSCGIKDCEAYGFVVNQQLGLWIDLRNGAPEHVCEVVKQYNIEKARKPLTEEEKKKLFKQDIKKWLGS